MLTASELARKISADLIGDADVTLAGVAAPESAGERDLIFVESARYAERAQNSRARCAIAGAGVELPGKTLLRVANPKLAFAQAAAILLPPAAPPAGIHASAVIAASARVAKSASIGACCVIEEDVEIGERTSVGAHGFIGRGARIGADCTLYPRVTLYAGAQLGDRVMVHSGAVLGSDGFGYVFGEGRHWRFPQVGGLVIEDDVEIGANTTVDRGSLGVTRIAAGSKLDNLVQIAHNVCVGTHSIIAAQTGVSGSSNIGSRAIIAGQVGIADGCRIEDGAVVGAQAGIPSGKRIHAGEPVWGTPARPLSKFKAQYALLSQLGRMFERLKRVESRLGITPQAEAESNE